MDTVIPGKPFVVSPRLLLRDGAGRWLFLRRATASAHWPGEWEPPGGKGDPGETLDETLAREVREETGLEFRALRVAGAAEAELERVRLAVVFMEAEALPGDIRLSEEHTEFAWLTPVQAVKLEIAPPYAAFVKGRAARPAASTAHEHQPHA